MPQAWVCFPGAPYTQRAALAAAQKVLEPHTWKVENGMQKPPSNADEAPRGRDAYIADYDVLPFDTLLGSQQLCSSYVIRKALIRKHFLAQAIHTANVKRGVDESMIPRTWTLDIQFADELDELLADDLYDLRTMLEDNENKGDKTWFILKPGMTDQANGIRLFASVERLHDIFKEFEDTEDSASDGDDAVMASQLRHFVVQEYISLPLLVAPGEPHAVPRKFHLRAYVICVGGLKVFLHDDMLALFASTAYVPPQGNRIDMLGHLSNTCVGERHAARGGISASEANVFLWQELEGKPATIPGGPSVIMTREHVNQVHRAAVHVLGTAFGAVAREASIHWQMWPNAFEIFGVDLMAGCAPGTTIPTPDSLRVWLLEINAVRSQLSTD